ncbi:adenylyl-sulfate kinase [Clostridium folliculivorans]|uniref:Adenylyl-sulfate kinase n=1 Tax=Clostridium folliculivorans TaxID=2886038 RepID=A0A9W5Y3N7_9CLOT|nr:adenylyl-sulfate kinase [Clostridium folliculivorans]GKU25958.1 adenylyl-sulfate kinase [Clostridium folliculivorans]GKU28044.1 adenylyl-sulfate kinase [Clostridium folliculivorans]
MNINNDANIVWHNTSISREDRERLLNQKGILLWFTGFSGSGKSTIANALSVKLHNDSYLTYLLDGDNLRHGLNSGLGFSKEDRIENIRRVKEVSKLFVDAGIITLATFVSPFREDRDSIRELLRDRFIEVFVDCDLEVCEDRDPKGLYKKARTGLIKDFTGIDSPYEKPDNPEITIYTHKASIEQCVEQIIAYLKKEDIYRCTT